MFFSVIVPIYQSSATIRSCLNSLITQRFHDFEVILVDDGSTDQSGEICKEYVRIDKRFQYFRKQNEGPSSTRNFGINRASGEFIVFLDSDDRYKDTYLESFYQLIQDNSNCGHYWCGYTTISDNPKEQGTGASFEMRDVVLFFDRVDLMTLHNRLFLASLCNKAFRTSIIRVNRLSMKKDLSLGEDLLFNLSYLDCCANTKIAVWNKPEYEYYCFSMDSLNHQYRSDLAEIFTVLRNEIMYCLKKWNVAEDQFVQYQTMVFYMLESVIQNYNRPECELSQSQKKQAVDKILQSEEFQEALKKGQVTINPIMKYAYKTGKSIVVLAANALVRIKRKII